MRNLYKTARWTEQAIYCYLRGCKCKGCSYNIKLESIKKCHMKASVLETVRVLGKPKENVILFEQGLKRCSKCGKIKKLEEYHANKRDGKNGKASYCMQCQNEASRAYRARKKKERENNDR